MAFSTEYLAGGQAVLVDRRSPYKGIGDLGGKKVCASTNSTSIATIDGAPSDPIPVGARSTADCMVLLQQGLVDAVSTGRVILAGLAEQDKNTHIVGPQFTVEPVGIAINLRATDLVRFVNGVLEQIRTSGEWAELYKQWLQPTLGHALAPVSQYRG